MTMPSARSVVAIAPLVAILLASTGCATRGIWDWANQDSLAFHRVAGIITTNTTSPQHFLAIEYQDAGTREFLRVPLEADGRPMPPYAYPGRASDDETFWNKVSDSRRRDILKSAQLTGQISPTDHENFIAADADRGDHGGMRFSSDGGQNELVAVAYRVQTDGWLIVDRKFGSPATDRPLTSHIALIPNYRPMPPAANDARRALAIVVTPFTLVFDIATLPVIVPAVVIFFPPTR
ncbi:MAG TPA: hypothetical protein VFE47_16130 [Tepidisphaeraceae bacterium]|jgi:hypothetical protein|nr:hypothetical protein [Tepidisphaeraceae bacterium]